MNFNFTLLSCVAKGTKWNFSIVPIIRLPEVNFSSTIDQLSQTREKFGYILPIRQFSTLEHILLSQGPGRWYWYKYKTFFAYLKEKNCKTHLKKHFWYIFYLGEKMTKRDYVQKRYWDDCHGKQINKVINTHDHGISYLVNNVNEKLHHHYNFWQVCKVWFIW